MHRVPIFQKIHQHDIRAIICSLFMLFYFQLPFWLFTGAGGPFSENGKKGKRKKRREKEKKREKKEEKKEKRRRNRSEAAVVLLTPAAAGSKCAFHQN